MTATTFARTPVGWYKAAIVVFIAVLVTLGAVAGWTLVDLFGFTAVTLYGLVVVGRKIVQLVFARVNNVRMRRLVRAPIVDQLVQRYPALMNEAAALLRRPLPFDLFRDAVFALLDRTYDQRVLEGIEAPERGVMPAFVRFEWTQYIWRELVAATFLAPEEGGFYVGVVVPTYRTSKLEIQRLVDSIENQSYPYIYVTIVLNEHDPDLKAYTQELIHRYSGRRYIRFVEPRRGKRNAMRMGFADFLEDAQRVRYIFNVDSDSELHPDAIANAVRLFESDPQIGCLTGDIRVSNPHVNLLTMLTYQRYFFAFNVERAAQSLFRGVTCMSGPFMGVRASTLARFLDQWAHQMFLGKLCSFGDDRHISTLTLMHGQASLYLPESIAWTDVPTQMPVWKLQQTRWARSAWRETIIMLPWIGRLPLWVIFDVVYLALFPFILWITVGLMLVRTARYGLDTFLPYVFVVVALAFVFNALYGMLANRDGRYMLNPLYMVYQFIYLQPLRIWALLSLNLTKWGTK